MHEWLREYFGHLVLMTPCTERSALPALHDWSSASRCHCVRHNMQPEFQLVSDVTSVGHLLCSVADAMNLASEFKRVVRLVDTLAARRLGSNWCQTFSWFWLASIVAAELVHAIYSLDIVKFECQVSFDVSYILRARFSSTALPQKKVSSPIVCEIL